MNVKEFFTDLPDPRIDRTKEHDLIDILMIAIVAVICGADDWNMIEEFGKKKQIWLQSFLGLRNGIPSHDTFNRVFSMIDPQKFGSCFIKWTNSICQLTDGEIISIDGKALKGTAEPSKGKSCIYLVSAWASENKLMLGQQKVAEKSNEITAIPSLLEALVVKDCIITIDAMGCQTSIAEAIIKKDADYILALKGNQGLLHQQVQQSFEKEKPIEFNTELDLGHGRIEKRTCSVISDLKWIDEPEKWVGLKTIVKIDSVFEEKSTGKISQDSRFYISSLEANSSKINTAIRKHWLIENSLHWCLDLAFEEDNSRIRKGFADQNFALLRRIALNLLKNNTTSKLGIKNKRIIAGWDDGFLSQLLKI
jgi:predicted transposase YbfD/YdcC